MSDRSRYEEARETAWCPGCGNFAIRKALVGALDGMGLDPWEVVLFSGIGQAAKMPHYLRVNGFNGLHGRALPPALGLRLAQPGLKVIVESGDGDTYGEGGNHLLHTIRRNPDVAHLVHNNQVYGLTKGQASPTTGSDFPTAVQPEGPTAEPLNPVRLAVALGASFVARGFAGNAKQLEALIAAALEHRGYALVDILQPCVSFNKVNTFSWYQERVYELDGDHDPTCYQEALARSEEWGERIPTGIFYRANRPVFRERFSHLRGVSLLEKEHLPADCSFLCDELR